MLKTRPGVWQTRLRLIVLCALWAVTIGQAAEGPSKKQIDLSGKAIPSQPQANEVCLACKQLLGPTDPVYQVKGQRIGLHKEKCLAAFEQNPDLFFAELQPRSALFHDDVLASKVLSDRWLYLGIYVLIGLVFAALCAHRAVQGGHSLVLWFFLGLFTNIVGYLILLTRPARDISIYPAGTPRGLVKVPTTWVPAKCKGCGMEMHPSAPKCPGCGSEMTPTVESEVPRIKH